MGMNIKRTTVDPAKAQALLATSKGNRPIREGVVHRYTRAMKMNTWHESPEAICLDERGALVNGHHRLQAVVRSDTTQVFWIAYDVPPKTVPNLDTGTVRSLGDRLSYYAKDRVFKRLCDNQPGKAKLGAAIANLLYNIFTGEKVPSVEEALRIVKHFEEGIAYALEIGSADKILRRSASLTAVTLAYHRCRTKKEQDAVRNFFNSVKTGEMMERGEPAYVLREYLLYLSHPKTRDVATRKRISLDSQWLIFIKTLRAVQADSQGERLAKLQAPKTGGRQLIEWYTGNTPDMVRALRLGTRDNRARIAAEAEAEALDETG